MKKKGLKTALILSDKDLEELVKTNISSKHWSFYGDITDDDHYNTQYFPDINSSPLSTDDRALLQEFFDEENDQDLARVFLQHLCHLGTIDPGHYVVVMS